MRFHLFPPFLTLLFLTLPLPGCGSDDPEAVRYADALDALDLGHAAYAQGDLQAARLAFQYAADHGRLPAVRATGTEFLMRSCAVSRDTLGALTALERLKADFPETLDAAKLNDMAQFMWEVVQSPGLSEAVIDYAEDLGVVGFSVLKHRRKVAGLRQADDPKLGFLGYLDPDALKEAPIPSPLSPETTSEPGKSADEDPLPW